MPAWPPRSLATAVLLLVTPLGGCAVVPRAQLEQSRRFSQALQAEVIQRRDLETKLRAQNSDLEARSIADLKQINGLQDYLDRQERAITELRDDRERLAADLERVLRLVREPSTAPTALRERLDQFAQSHPGVVHDPEALACSIPQGRLFVPGETRLSPLGRTWLQDLAQLFHDHDPGASPPRLLVGPGRDAVVLASTTQPEESLTANRTRAVQEFLVETLGQGRARIAIDPEEPADTPRRVITVRLDRPPPRAPGVDDPSEIPK